MPRFRGFPACACLAEWLPEYEKEALRLGYIKFHLDLYQLIGGSPKSAGTHTKGGAADTGQISTDLIRLARDMGADAAWHRPYNWDRRKGMAHAHLVLRGCPHNGPARYQIDSPRFGVDYGKNGLANGGKDTGPKPLSKRTWKQGIEWAKRRQAAAMEPAPDPLLAPDTTLTIAYWNIGPLPYSNLKAADKAHIAQVIEKLKVAKCSLAVLLELHEENGVNGALGYFKLIMPADWHVFEGDGGNQLVSMGGKYDLIQKENHMSRKRAFTLWNLRRKSTGLAFWVNGLHVSAGRTPARVYDRNTQIKDFVAQTRHHARAISCIDKNNAVASPGSPTKQLKDAGIVSMFDALAGKVAGAVRNTYHGNGKVQEGEKNIDFIGGHRLVTFLKGEQVNTDDVGGNDHDLLVATVLIEGTLP